MSASDLAQLCAMAATVMADTLPDTPVNTAADTVPDSMAAETMYDSPDSMASEKMLDCPGQDVVKLGWVRSISGPYQKKKARLTITPAPTVVDGDEFVALKLSDEWICRFLTGKHPAERPCAHTNIINVLKKSLTQKRNELIAQPQSSSIGSQLGIVTKKTKYDSCQRTGKATGGATKQERAHFKQAKTITVQVPSAPGSKRMVNVTMLNDLKTTSIKLDSASSHWLFNYFDCEERAAKVTMKESLQNEGEYKVQFERARNAYFVYGPLQTEVFQVLKMKNGKLLSPEDYKNALAAVKEQAEDALQAQIEQSQMPPKPVCLPVWNRDEPIEVDSDSQTLRRSQPFQEEALMSLLFDSSAAME